MRPPFLPPWYNLVAEVAMKTTIRILLLMAAFPSVVFAHGGGLDGSGCHTNRKTGDYHCHGSSQARPQPSNAPQQVAPEIPSRFAGPTCYTGPRGGLYTITPSGRKNYSGC